MTAKIIRCAIYTRKSTEHNLDLEFNSLHAQREACEAYIKSQLHEGWQLIPAAYDDGGISGASLDRPDLQRLLADISAGKVDNVVVYKVDRLTRSLTDFAKLVELFDKYGVSFVSVTQAFNTTSSMGRLTLNVLLSFAQFEREVIGERVRDKIAASKKKGLFMGGNVPLGYTNKNKKLVIVPEEATQVRWMFQRYLELGSIGCLLEEMNTADIRTKVTILASGRKRGGVPYGKGALAYLLKNRSYVGEISHKGAIHPADHEPIIDRKLFNAVQTSLSENTVARKVSARASPFLLAGLIFDSAGNRMTPSHSRKKGVRYRYYISQAVLQSRKAHCGHVVRVPAREIEAQMELLIRDRCRGQQGDMRALIESQIAKITVQQDSISVELASPSATPTGQPAEPAQTASLPWSKRSLRAAKGLAEPEPSAPAAEELWSAGRPSLAKFSEMQMQEDLKAREALLTAIGKAREWIQKLDAGAVLSDIAKQEGKTERHIRLLVPLAFTSPGMTRDITNSLIRPRSIMEFANAVPLTWSSGPNILSRAASEI